MTIAYTWNFDPLETKPSEDGLSDVVKTVHWQLYGVDDETGNTGRTIGAQSLSSPDSDEFVLFEDLTQDIVKQWVLSGMINPEEEELETVEAVEDSLKEKIAQQIEKKNNPPIVNRKAPLANTINKVKREVLYGSADDKRSVSRMVSGQ